MNYALSQENYACTISFPLGKYEYQKLPIRICNNPDIFNAKINELFNSLEYVRTYIDDLLIIRNKPFEHHINKLDKLLNKVKQKSFKVNAEKIYFARNELEYLGFMITK